MGKRIFITVQEIADLTGKSYCTALRKYITIKDALEKKEHQGITFQEYADYEGVNVEEIRQSLTRKPAAA